MKNAQSIIFAVYFSSSSWGLMVHESLYSKVRPQPSYKLHAVEDGFVESEATTVAGVLSELWGTIRAMPEGSDPVAVVFPACENLRQQSRLSALFEHLECCKDVCDRFGTRLAAIPSVDGNDGRALVLREVSGGDSFDDDDDDDDWELSPELLAKLRESEGEDMLLSSSEGIKEEFGYIEASDEEILEVTKRWVDAVISGAGVCPFSVNADRAGLPPGYVRYEIANAADAEAAYFAYWQEVVALMSATEADISTTLLILTHPRWTRNLEEFETLGSTLGQALDTQGLGLDADLQLVFFHPGFVFRDGQDRAGQARAANFARRSPYPMINILRTKQVRAAQKGLPTALVYQQNELTLAGIGPDLLDSMLENRDWEPLDGKKVDRKQIEVLRLAQDLMKESTADKDN